jgi:hypothetical protein
VVGGPGARRRGHRGGPGPGGHRGPPAPVGRPAEPSDVLQSPGGPRHLLPGGLAAQLQRGGGPARGGRAGRGPPRRLVGLGGGLGGSGHARRDAVRGPAGGGGLPPLRGVALVRPRLRAVRRGGRRCSVALRPKPCTSRTQELGRGVRGHPGGGGSGSPAGGFRLTAGSLVGWWTRSAVRVRDGPGPFVVRTGRPPPKPATRCPAWGSFCPALWPGFRPSPTLPATPPCCPARPG